MRLRSYRVNLASFAILLVIAFCVLCLGASYFYTESTVEDLTGRQFREISRREVLQTKQHLHAALPALATLDGLLSGELADAPAERRAAAFLDVLRANPGFTWVSYSDESGGFLGVYRTADGRVRVNRSSLREGKTELFEHEVESDGSWRQVRHETDTHYDPRQRPFYTLAKEAGHQIWTKPYVFFEQGIPGITCALPHFSATPAGRSLAGVFTIDFDLNALSAFTRHADLSEHGTVFVFTLDGTLIAHPDVSVVAKSGNAASGDLLLVTDVADPRMKAFQAEAERQHEVFAVPESDEKVENFSFSTPDGTRFLASYDSFAIDGGTRWVVGAYAPEQDFIGSLRSTTLWFFAGILLLSIAAVFAVTPLFASRLARPLLRLSEEMERIGRFDLAETTLPPSRVREIAAMNQAVGAMKSGLRSFARYVPRDLVRSVLDSGREALLGGETREMTVFFSDIEGFTSIAESMAPDELVRMLGEYLDEMTRVIASTGGTVDKFLGDGILAFWGAPKSDEKHALHAAEAALACRARLDAIAARGGFSGRVLKTRIGLATGPVLVGNIGTPERMNYTVMGDTANLASRLEGLNKAYGTSVLVAEETARALAGKILARPVDVVAVKGKAHAVKVYELLARAGEDSRAPRMVALSEQALGDYLGRDFSNAVAGWSALLELAPGDRAATVMRARAEAFLATAPPATWNGVFVATEK